MDWTAEFQQFVESLVFFIPKLITALVIFVAAVILGGLASRSVRRAARPKVTDPGTLRLLGRLARWTVIVVGTLAALDQVDFDVTSFVAGLGIAGFTLGFALQDIARNFVAGILLLIRQPFNIGESVKIGGYAGTVMDVSTRDTVIKTWDGEKVIIPNSDVFTQAITNYSDLPLRRRTIRIGLGYDEDVGRAVRAFMKAIRGVEGVLADPQPTVLVEELGDSALMLAARFWVDQGTHSLFEVHSAAVQAIKETAAAGGIDLPYPTQTVRLQGDWPAAT